MDFQVRRFQPEARAATPLPQFTERGNWRQGKRDESDYERRTWKSIVLKRICNAGAYMSFFESLGINIVGKLSRSCSLVTVGFQLSGRPKSNEQTRFSDFFWDTCFDGCTEREDIWTP